jgi:hypothetical protein
MIGNRLMAIRAAVLGAVAIAVVGCGGPKSAQSGSDSKEADHLRNASALISQYTIAAKKQPTKIEEVRDWAVKGGKATEEDFASTRDKELYVIEFTGQGLGLREQTGKNGKCYIMRMGSISEIPVKDMEEISERSKQMQKRMKRGG